MEDPKKSETKPEETEAKTSKFVTQANLEELSEIPIVTPEDISTNNLDMTKNDFLQDR